MRRHRIDGVRHVRFHPFAVSEDARDACDSSVSPPPLPLPPSQSLPENVRGDSRGLADDDSWIFVPRSPIRVAALLDFKKNPAARDENRE